MSWYYQNLFSCLCRGRQVGRDDAEMAEEGLHVDAERFVVAVDARPSGRLAALTRTADTGEDRVDYVLAKDAERGDRARGLRWNVIAARSLRFREELFCAELADVVGGLSGAVVALPGHRVHLLGELSDGEAFPCGRERDDAGEHGARTDLVEVDAADARRAEAGRPGKLVEDLAGQVGDVDAVEHDREPLEHRSEARDDLGETLEHSAAAELAGVVDDCLEAQDVLAFGAGLQGQEPEVDLEHREVVRRCLDHDCLARRELAVRSLTRALFLAEEGPELSHVEACAAPVDDAVEHRLHLRAGGEQELPAELDLVDGVVVAEATRRLFVQIEPEAETSAVDPAVTDLAESPCRLFTRQGVCDLGQARGVRDPGEAVSLLSERDPSRARSEEHTSELQSLRHL